MMSILMLDDRATVRLDETTKKSCRHAQHQGSYQLCDTKQQSGVADIGASKAQAPVARPIMHNRHFPAR
jgi:hypothetical protein